MKNESRIEELLAESLGNQDRQSEKLDNVVDAVKDMSKAVHQLTDVVETMITKYDKIDDHEKRIRSIERKLDAK